MSLVTLGDQAKALQMLGAGSAKRDELLLSLARHTTWTTKQRALIDRMWDERQQHKEATMKKTATLLAVLVAMGLCACAETYVKRFTDKDGRAVVIQERHDADWWNTLGTPDWVNVRHERITRDGEVIADRHCRHEPTQPWLLDCTNGK